MIPEKQRYSCASFTMKSSVSFERLVWLCSETPEANPLAARPLFQRYEIREPVISSSYWSNRTLALAATQYLCDRSCAQYVVQLVNAELLPRESTCKFGRNQR